MGAHRQKQRQESVNLKDLFFSLLTTMRTVTPHSEHQQDLWQLLPPYFASEICSNQV